MVLETISLYLRNGSPVFGCLMDCTKAFDTVQHSLLFKKLIEAKIPVIFVRLLIFMYQKQTADVRWQSTFSKEFKMQNGVRQGSVLSPILFCFYMNDLFRLLRESKSGCHIESYYAGCFGYADDLLLLSPSRNGLQEQLNIAQKYASDHNISFSTNIDPKKSKTKGIIFSKHEMKREIENVLLNENPLLWVQSAKYLGNRLTNKINGLCDDVLEKRARYIEKNFEINQEFPYAHPKLKCTLNHIYNTSFSGSVLWDYSSREAEMLINTWSVSIRHMWNLPLQSHRYFIEPLGGKHLKSMLYSRFLKFINSIKSGNKIVAKLLLEIIKNNTETITGRNIKKIEIESEKSNIKNADYKNVKDLKFCEMSENDEWKIGLIIEMTDIKQGKLFLDFSNEK